MTDADRVRLRGSVKVGEGLRLKLYKDSLGYWTIGYGRLLDPAKGGSISRDEADYLLANDLKHAEEDCETLPAYAALSPARQAVLIEMRFNLGGAGLRGFKRMLAALQQSQYDRAADSMLASRWRQQVGQRAVRMAEQMRTGQWQA